MLVCVLALTLGANARPAAAASTVTGSRNTSASACGTPGTPTTTVFLPNITKMLGNSLPHLHTHVVPRYLNDGEPGHPPHFMRIDLQNEPLIPDEEYARDVAALRDLLARA